jgi:O-antigen ligase/tetratricopeptide (TPR) repeat protein
MLGRGRSFAALALLTVVVGYAVVSHGGDAPHDSTLSLAALGLTAIAAAFLLGAAGDPLDGRAVQLAVLLFPAYIAFQLLPQRLAILRVLSPTRAEVTAALGGVAALPRSAPLTISTASTTLHLGRVTGCVLVFLLVRQLARRSVWRPWAATVPLMGLAIVEAAWAFTQSVTGAEQVTGSYGNRNHLAGLLEMVMPFAAVYGVAILSRSRRGGPLPVSDAAKACVALAIALALFLAILLSLSKGGTFASLGSVVLMGVLALEGRTSGWRRWALAAGLVLGCAVIVVFLTPASLVERFSALASDDASEGRVPIWVDTLHLVRAYPLFGAGMGTFYPALLRYQTVGLEFIWTAAHNDYLQSLSELGIVGFVFPAVAVGGAFLLAIRTAIAGAHEAREVGLACAGGLAAFLIHSISDFNGYVLSNAMVVAWIAGLSAAVYVAPRDGAIERSTGRVVHGYVMGAGCLLTLYSGAWLFLYHWFEGNPVAERAFCRFGVCDTETALATLRGPDRDAAVPIENLVEYLQRDPANPSRWEDLGAGLQKSGRIDAARYCLFRAVALAPNSPPTLAHAARFEFEQRERRTALDLVSRSLRAGDAFDEEVFSALEERRVPVADVLEFGLPDRRSAQAYLRRLFKNDRVDDAQQAWEWIVPRGDANDKLANEYVDFHLRLKQPEAAAAGFALYERPRNPGYPDSNRIFNGGFESNPMGARFDWRIEVRSGMTIDFDEAVHSSGKRSLRIRFDGTQNPGDIGLEQAVFLPPGRYRFEAHVRTEDVSTDQGVAFRLVSEERQQALDVITDNIRGSSDWTMLERDFDAPPGGGLTRVSVVRKPSLKFDNLIKGTAWIDHVSISPFHP